MRIGPVITAGALLALAPASVAQVTVNPGALETLPSHPPAQRHPPAPPQHQQARPASRNAQQRPAEANPPPASTSPPSSPAKPAKPEKPVVPVTPPAILALPPPVPVPLAHPPPPPTIPAADDAPGTATPIANGVRVTFGPDRFDLNPASVAALRSFAQEVKDKETSINVYAYAAGSSEDPSTPRRLSLLRALAARAVLMDEGIPSARIYPRALGPAGGETDRDRVDVVAGQPSPPPPATPAP
ncbi:MAG: OmpA family protein [Acetobacteraceae bacterium]|nr:OmpA family protein [Acetobacteraceae bacterium]